MKVTEEKKIFCGLKNFARQAPKIKQLLQVAFTILDENGAPGEDASGTIAVHSKSCRPIARSSKTYHV